MRSSGSDTTGSSDGDRGVRDAGLRLEALSRFLDCALRVPGTDLRIGADALLNLMPVVGTLTAKALSAYLIWEARRIGAPAPMLARMIGNAGVDFLIGAMPVVGWIGDAFYRANQRNIALLRGYLDQAQGPPIIDVEPVPVAGAAR